MNADFRVRIPRLEKKGWLPAMKKKSRSHQTGADGVVAHELSFGVRC